MYKHQDNSNAHTPEPVDVREELAKLTAMDDDEGLMQYLDEASGAIAYVHFDSVGTKSNMIEALVHHKDLTRIDRGLYVSILSRDKRVYSGRIVEGPFYDPDALRRDSTPVQFIIMNQGERKLLSLPEYHGRIQIEILGEERNEATYGAVRRPHPASPVFPYDATKMAQMLELRGNIRLGILDNYENVFVDLDEEDKGVMPRNMMTVGTIGSGKSNTTQVLIEETLAAGFAQVVLDPEGEYIFMDQEAKSTGIHEELRRYERKPQGIKPITVYRPPLSTSKRADAIEFSVPFDSLSPEMIVELTEMSSAQENRFTFLYEQAVQCILKEPGERRRIKQDDLDISRGFDGMTLQRLLTMLEDELEYYNQQRGNRNSKTGKQDIPQKEQHSEKVEALTGESDSKAPEKRYYFHKYQLLPLIRDPQDAMSYGALRKKLRELQMTRLFDRKDAPPLNARSLCLPGQLAVIDMSDCGERQISNIIIADLLTRIYRYKMNLNEEQNALRKVIITIEEAHGFVSREKQDKMEQTLDQLRRIARRGRKRWLCLHFVTQSPQHLPPELFELANNKIIHQITGSENLRILKAAAGTVNESIWDEVPSLGRGRAVIISSQYPHPLIAHIRPAASKRNYQN